MNETWVLVSSGSACLVFLSLIVHALRLQGWMRMAAWVLYGIVLMGALVLFLRRLHF